MKQCILVYEDDQDLLDLSKMILEQRNYKVETRLYCDDIISDISLVKPDLILMDLWIPEIGGENAIKLMKNHKATQHIPVILFSANVGIEDIFKRTNADGFIKKPFEIHEFIDTSKEIFGAKQLSSSIKHTV
jgi:DNA-binding NtrC family response regulator